MEALTNRPTIREYYNDSYKFTSTATILKIELDSSSPLKASILLDRTIFHPQEGGQPSDKGEIESVDAKNGEIIRFKVLSLITNRETDTIWHQGEYEKDYSSKLEVSDSVKLTVDEAARRFNARLHSAGHLIDMAVSKLNLKWSPGKGYHFSDGPYVEYQGSPVDDMGALAKKIQELCNEFIIESEENNKVSSKVYNPEEAENDESLPQDLRNINKSFRYVRLSNKDNGCPCGGTHVKSLKDLIEIEITKVAKKGKNVRVSYNIKST